MSKEEKEIKIKSVTALKDAGIITEEKEQEILAELEAGKDDGLNAMYDMLEQRGKEARLKAAISSKYIKIDSDKAQIV